MNLLTPIFTARSQESHFRTQQELIHGQNHEQQALLSGIAVGGDVDVDDMKLMFVWKSLGFSSQSSSSFGKF